MSDVNFSMAQINWSIFEGAMVSSGDWQFAMLGTSFAPDADLSSSKNLASEGFGGIVGNDRTIVPSGLYVDSCLQASIEDFESNVLSHIQVDEFRTLQSLAETWLCPEGESPQKTGFEISSEP